jgi:Zn-dependent protease with chaperone function
MYRALITAAAVAMAAFGCASSDKSTNTIRDHWQTGTFGAPAGTDLSAADAEAAGRARILADVPAREVEMVAVVATARTPIYAQASAGSRKLGTLKQGGTVAVVEQSMWYRVPEEWYGGRWGEVDGNLPTWAKVRFENGDGGEIVGFVPWRSLDRPDRYEMRNPADVQTAADAFAEEGLDATQKDFSRKKSRDQKRRLAGMTKGMADGVTIASNWPDFDALDPHILVGEARFMPSDAPSEGLEIDFKDPTPAERFFVGRVQAGKILASQPSYPPDTAISAYVRGVGDRVAKVSSMPRPYAEWVWLVVESPDLNAFALPGGFVFITTGMLDFLANEDELAAVLAHEVAHVEQGHSMDAVYRAIFGDETNRAVDDGASLAKQGGGLLSAFGIEEGEDIQAGVETAEALDEALGIRAAIFDGIMKGYDQSSETEADARSVSLAAAAGYDPRAMSMLITRMVEAGLAGPESHYSPKRRPQIVSMTEAFLSSQRNAGVEIATVDSEAAARYRAAVEAALAEIPADRDSEAAPEA